MNANLETRKRTHGSGLARRSGQAAVWKACRVVSVFYSMLLLLLAGVQPAAAIWNGASSGIAYSSGGVGDYDYTGNWVGSTIDDSFAGFLLTGALTVTLDNNRTTGAGGLNLNYDGAFGLTLTGITSARTLTLGGDVTADTVAGGQTVTIGGGSTVLLNLGTVNRNFTVGAGDTLIIANAIADTTGGITKQGTGLLQLNAANLYDGLTQVDAGELRWNIAGAVEAGNLTINNTATVNMQTFADTVGTVTLNAGGAITGSSGILTTGTGGLVTTGGSASFSGAGGIALGGTTTAFTYNTSAGSETQASLDQIILGGGTTAKTFTLADGAPAIEVDITENLSNASSAATPLVKAGAGVLQLSGSTANINRSTATTAINDGTLLLNKSASVDAIGGSGTITIGDGTGAAGSAILRYTAASANDQIVNNAVTINSDGLWDLNGKSETTSGALTHSSGGAITTGAGTLTLGAAANTISGASTVTGNLTFSGTAVGNLAIGGTATINGTTTFTGASGGITATGTPTIQGTLALGAVAHPIAVTAGSDNLTVSAALTGGGSTITKSGAGTLTLTGSSGSFSDAWTISAGKVTATQASSLGTGAVTLNTAASSTLELKNNSATTYGNNVTVGFSGVTINVDNNGSGSGNTLELGALNSGAYTLNVTGGNGYGLKFTGATTLTGATVLNAGVNVELAGAVSGNFGLTKTGAGTLKISNTDSSTSTLTIGASGGASGGTVQMGAAGSLPSGAITIYGGTLDLNGQNYTTGALLTIGGGAAGTTAVVATGAGTLTLGNGITYSATGNPLGATIGGNLALGTAVRTITVGNSSNADDDLNITAAVSSGTGGALTKDGAGTLRLSAGVAIDGHLTVGSAAGGGVCIVAETGTLTFGTASELRIAYSTANSPSGTFTFSSTVAPLSVPGNMTIGYTDDGGYPCSGVFNQGDGTTVTIAGDLSMGNNGDGAFNQGANTAVTVGGHLTVGGNYGSSAVTVYTVPTTGRLTLSGAASDLRVAYGGNRFPRGTFTYNGTAAPLNVPGNVVVAYSTDGGYPATGAFNQGAGATVNIGGNLTVGASQSNTGNGGEYAVGAGGVLALTGATSDLLVANGRSSRGTFTCNGSLDVARNVTLGYSDHTSYLASGTINQGDGTTVSIGGDLTVGGYCTSAATYNQGANTAVSVGGNLTVGNGYNSSVSYTVPASGTLALTGTAANVYIAYGRNGRGTFTYNGTAAPLNVPGNVVVAYSTDGSYPATGSFNQGPGSAVTIGGTLTVGSTASHATGGGVYTMGDDASLTLNGAASDLLIAYGYSGRGTLTSSGTLAVARNVVIGWHNNSSYDATGSLLLEPGSVTTVGGNLTVGDYCTQAGDGGVCSVSAGATLTVMGATTIANANYSIGRMNVNGGTVNLTGALTIGGSGGNRDGQLNLNSGAVNLPRQTTVSAGGTFTNTAGTLRFGLAGTVAGTSYDQVTVSGGTLTLGGNLEVELEGGYTPGPLDTYTIVTRSSGTLSGVFANAPVSGQKYTLGAAQARVTYNGNNTVVLSEVGPLGGTPTLSSPGVSNVTTTTAAAYVALGGAAADVYLVWDTSDKGQTLSAWGATNVLGAKPIGQIDNAAITGLSTGTTYTCAFFASNTVSGETGWSVPVTFRTYGPPLVTTLAESGVTYNSAVLNGNVVATGGVPTTVRVYWGTTDAYPNYTGWAGTNDFSEISEGTTNYTATGLAYHTTYYYRYYATNSYGECWGAAESFTPPLHAAIYFNNANGDWHTAAHWNPTQAPIAADTAYINDSRIATIQSGNSGVVSNLNLAYGTYQNGTLNVDGTLTVSGNAAVGYSTDGSKLAAGAVNMGDDATVSIAGDLTLGQNANGVINQGANSALGVGGILTVGGAYGSSASTTYTVPDSGTLTLSGAASDLRIAYSSGRSARGTFTFNSTVGPLTVPGNVVVAYSTDTGYPATGAFNQGAGTTVNIGGSLTVGAYATSTGNGGEYTVGAGGALALTGATSDLLVAYGRSSRGTLTCNGSLDVARNVTIGYSDHSSYLASGTINQGDGTTVSIGGDLTVGGYCTSAATYNQGANTAVSVGGNLVVGNGYNSSVSYTVPATGTLTLTGPASNLLVAYGRSGRGTFTYNSTAATLTIPGSVTVGYSDHSSYPATGAFNQGAGATVNIGGSLTVGAGQSNTGNGGEYTVGASGALALTGATSDLLVAYGRSSQGTFTCNGSLDVARNVTIGYSDHGSYRAAGSFVQGADSAVVIGGNLTLGSSNSNTGEGGEYTVGSGASLAVTGTTAISTAAASTGRLHVDGGTVTFTGALTLGNATGNARLNLNSGTVNLPRQTTVGAGGVFTNDTGTLRFGLAGTVAGADYDQVTVSGGTMYLDGDLAVELEGAYVPGAGDTFTIVTLSSGTLSGVFANAPVSGNTYSLDSVQAKVTYNANSVVLSEVEPLGGTPTLSSPGVSNVTTTTAAAYVALGGAAADVYLVWDTSDKGQTLSAWGATNVLGAKPIGQIDNAAITGLSSGTFYTCAFFASNTVSGETGWSVPVTFYSHGAPFVTTLAESGLTYDSAVLNGNVVATGGVATTVRVYFGTTDAYPNYTGWTGTNDFGVIGAGATNYTATGLAYYTTYHYRYYATNDYGEFWGDAESFIGPLYSAIYFNNADGDWNTAAHWLPTQVPIYADTAYINGNRIATLQSGNSGEAADLRVAYGNSERGTLNVADGSLTVASGVTVAYSGNGSFRATGSFNQSAGTDVTIGGTLSVGRANSNTGSGGVYTMGSGASLKLTSATSDLLIGYDNSAVGSFTCNGTLEVGRHLTLGYSGATANRAAGTFNQGSNTTVTVGGNLTIGGYASIDTAYTQGTNTSVSVGGDLTVGNGYNETGSGVISYTVPASGTLALTGTAANVYIAYGRNGRGTFTYNSTTAPLTIAGNVTVGYSDNSSFDATGTFEQGPGSSVAIGGSLTVGSSYTAAGSGAVYTMGDGASLTLTGAASDLLIAYGSDGRGTFTCNGPLVVPRHLTLGYSSATANRAAGTFNQGSNTTVTVGGNLTIGGYASIDTAYTQGTNTSVSVGGDLTVGNGYNETGSGVISYTVPASGTLALTGTAANVYIAYGRNGRGTFTYNSTTAPLTIAGNVTVGYSDSGSFRATGSLIQGAGSSVAITGNLTVGSSNSQTGNGGEYVVGTGATLSVTGTTAIATAAASTGRLHVDGGTVAFTGNLSIGGGGQLNLNSGAVNLPRQTTLSAAGGTFTHTAGTLRFGLAGTVAGTSHDRVMVSGGTLTLGGNLEVELESGYTPGPTDTYTIITRSSGTLSGVFANAPVSGSRYSIAGTGSFVVTYTGTSVVLSEYVGSPATVITFK